MSAKEELTKLIMESYERGVKDSQQAALAAIEFAYIAGAEGMRARCADLCYQLVDNSRETRFATAIRAIPITPASASPSSPASSSPLFQ